MTDAGALRDLAETVSTVDREWMKKIPSADDKHHIPWIPFPVDQFVSMLWEANAAAAGKNYLEIGCGPGTKMLIAQTLFGLKVFGFDRVPEFVERARDLNGLTSADLSDAGKWDDFGNYDIIWFNRVFRPADEEQALEARVWETMKPGAVVMCANLDAAPPTSWFIVVDDWEIRRGVWMKPPVR